MSKERALELLADGKTKNEILTDLVQNAGLDLAAAAKVYNEAATEGGYRVSNEEKASAVAEVFQKHNTENGFDRAAATDELMAAVKITKLAAEGHLRKAAEAAGVEWPKAARQGRDHAAIAHAVKVWHDEGATEESIKAGLMQHYNFTEKGVEAAYRKYGKAAGFIEARAGGDRAGAVQFMFDNQELPRKEWIAKMIEELSCSKATAETRYSIFLYAQDYAKLSAAAQVQAAE